MTAWHYKSLRHYCTIAALLCHGSLSMLLLSGCKNPCKELADKVCSCKSTLAEQHVCQTDMSARKRFYEIPRTENEQECQRILDANTCTCSNLDLGKVEACGMTRNPPAAQNDKQMLIAK